MADQRPVTPPLARTPVTADEKLAAIAALCDVADEPGNLTERIVLREKVRAILDAPSVGAAQPHTPRADPTIPPTVILDRDAALAAAEQYGEQLEAVGEELNRWKSEVRLVGKNREHAERLEDILEGERS